MKLKCMFGIHSWSIFDIRCEVCGKLTSDVWELLRATVKEEKETAKDELRKMVAKTKDQAKLLIVAASSGDDEIAMSAYAKLKQPLGTSANVNAEDRFGKTLLMYASANGRAELVAQLLAAGADVRNVCRTDDATALFEAAFRGHEEVVRQLIEAQADVDAVANGNRTPLFIAAEFGHAKVINRLLTANAKVNLSDKDGTTPVIIAKAKGHSHVVELLVANGATTDLTVKVRISHKDAQISAFLKLLYIWLVDHAKSSDLKPAYYEDIGLRFLGIDYETNLKKKSALIDAMAKIVEIDIKAGRPPLPLIAVRDNLPLMPDPSIVRLVESFGVKCSDMMDAFSRIREINIFWKYRTLDFEIVTK